MILFADTVGISCWRNLIHQQSEVILSISAAFVSTTMTYHSPRAMVATGPLGDPHQRSREEPQAQDAAETRCKSLMLAERCPRSEADRLSLVMFFVDLLFPNDISPGMSCRPGPSKILLGNTTSALSIKKGGAPVRGLRSKSRPFVVAAELAIPIFFRDRFTPMFHFRLRVDFRYPFRGRFGWKRHRAAIVHAWAIFPKRLRRSLVAAPAALRTGAGQGMYSYLGPLCGAAGIRDAGSSSWIR
jgi:hypothetical protein